MDSAADQVALLLRRQVEVGGREVQVVDVDGTGQIAGTSGTSEPHLHFMVYQEYPDRVEDDDVPVNFRNAEGPLDDRGGLMWGYVYEAVPE